ncbi:MAG: AIPR family protein [Rhodobacteraceae bacterium]|nr:AIPR family protein [Paracoccaceae bacterium]
MNEAKLLSKFAEDFHQEIIAESDSDEIGKFRVDQFTSKAADYLIDAEEIDDVCVCYYKARGMQLNGYNISQDEDSLDLLISIYNQQLPPISVTKTECETAFRQAKTCLYKGISGHYRSLEEASEIYDTFQRIYEIKNKIIRCRIFLLTDGTVKQEEFKGESYKGISISFNVWDIRKIYRFATSGRKFEPIEIDFEEDFGSQIPCLNLVDPESDYKGYLAVIPGEILAGVYDKYGPRLLERNVRSFLQARGKINKGIRNTILFEPHRFFAYNNGITATADHIEFKDNNGQICIKSVRNLQIVNGGQTTASLYHTVKKDKAELEGIFVQAKLSLIPEEYIDEIVPLISRFANSQNRVVDADFYANDPFHINIEEFSRTVWTPPIQGTSRTTHWFYERARGQYQDAKGKEITPAQKRAFEALTPARQKFTKTDLAKYENTWMQLPHIVSLGAQKNFIEFTIRLKERGKVKVDIEYYHHLIAKAILFKKADKIIFDQKYGGHKANIVTYTLAWLSHHTSQRIDLDHIWKKQDITPALQEAIREVSYEVQRIIKNPPNNRNITEWCKRKECWDIIRKTKINFGTRLEGELIDIGKISRRRPDKGINKLNEEEQKLINKIDNIPADQWFQISKWAKETNNLDPWQRSLSFSIGKIMKRSGVLSHKQAKHGVKILKESESLGFKYQYSGLN